MKLLVILVSITVAVSGKSILESGDAEKNTEESMKFMAGIDPDVRSKFLKAAHDHYVVVGDSGKTINEKIRDISVLSQQAANLWKEFAIKYKGSNVSHSTEAELQTFLANSKSQFGDREKLKRDSENLLGALDADIKSEMEKEENMTLAVIIDPSKTLEEKYNTMAVMAQRTADLWKQAADKTNSISTSNPPIGNLINALAL